MNVTTIIFWIFEILVVLIAVSIFFRIIKKGISVEKEEEEMKTVAKCPDCGTCSILPFEKGDYIFGEVEFECPKCEKKVLGEIIQMWFPETEYSEKELELYRKFATENEKW